LIFGLFFAKLILSDNPHKGAVWVVSTLTSSIKFAAGFDCHRHLGGQPTPYNHRECYRDIAPIDWDQHFLFTQVTTCQLGLFSRIMAIVNTEQLVQTS